MTEYVNSLAPCGKYILFTFIGETIVGGTVSDKTDWGFEFQVSTAGTEQPPRWGEVHAVGEDVNTHLPPDKQIKQGSFVYIEPLMWTEHMVIDDRRIWWTSADKIMLVQDEKPSV